MCFLILIIIIILPSTTIVSFWVNFLLKLRYHFLVHFFIHCYIVWLLVALWMGAFIRAISFSTDLNRSIQFNIPYSIHRFLLRDFNFYDWNFLRTLQHNNTFVVVADLKLIDNFTEFGVFYLIFIHSKDTRETQRTMGECWANLNCIPWIEIWIIIIANELKLLKTNLIIHFNSI